MSQLYKTLVIAGGGIGIGWGIAEGYAVLEMIGLAIAGGFLGAMIAFIKERILK